MGFKGSRVQGFKGSRVQEFAGVRSLRIREDSTGRAQFWPERQAQWAPPAPHPPPIGIAAFALPLDDPTIPGLDNRLTRFEPRHDGHSAFRSAVTNASKSRAQSLQLYSKMGILGILSMVNDQVPTSNIQGTPNFQFPRISSSRLPFERWEFFLGVGPWECLGSWKLEVGS
jgi:hypothetical protein